MKSFNCDECIHMNVCPAYMVTRPECGDFLPIGNVLPVVRCKDCIYAELIPYLNKTYCKCPDIYRFGLCSHEVSENHFCSYGERKTDGEVTKVL